MKVLRLQKVKELTTFSRSTIYRLMALGKFPLKINLSTNSIGWLESDINDYLQECVDKSKGVV